MKESGLPNWAKTPDLNSKDPKQPEIIEEETPGNKKEPFSKRRDSSGSANGKRKDSAEESKQKVEVKTPQQTIATPKKTPSKEKTLQEKSPLKSPPSPSKTVPPGSPSKQRRGMVRSESAQVTCKQGRQ